MGGVAVSGRKRRGNAPTRVKRTRLLALPISIFSPEAHIHYFPCLVLLSIASPLCFRRLPIGWDFPLFFHFLFYFYFFTSCFIVLSSFNFIIYTSKGIFTIFCHFLPPLKSFLICSRVKGGSNRGKTKLLGKSTSKCGCFFFAMEYPSFCKSQGHLSCI